MTTALKNEDLKIWKSGAAEKTVLKPWRKLWRNRRPYFTGNPAREILWVFEERRSEEFGQNVTILPYSPTTFHLNCWKFRTVTSSVNSAFWLYCKFFTYSCPCHFKKNIYQDRYRPAIESARIILLNYHLDVKGKPNEILLSVKLLVHGQPKPPPREWLKDLRGQNIAERKWPLIDSKYAASRSSRVLRYKPSYNPKKPPQKLQTA